MKSLGKYRILTLLAGLATALLIVFSQLFYFQAATYCQKKADTEHRDQKDTGHETYISIPSSSIFSASNIEINQDLSFVIETLFDCKNETQSTVEVSPSIGRLFQTLFRFIIAPNAP
jgi:hypothetical protein